MKAVNSNTRKRNMLISVLALLITAGLAFILFTSLKQMDGVSITAKSSNNNRTATTAQDNALLVYDEQLHAKLNSLQQLDNEFTDLLISSLPVKNYDSLNKIILQQEEVFRKSIDSINHQGAVLNTSTNSLFSKMIASFKSILESRKSVGSLRNAVSIGQSSFTPDETALFKLQEELMTKTNRVITLENSLSELEKKTTNIPSQLTNNQKSKFADSIKFVANINVLETKIATLNANINELKQYNDRLLKQQSEGADNAITNEALVREKTILQQRLDFLNAELQMARVDCNLSRADATQIISTAKQRKLLLNEASSILTNLSATGNAEVKRKAQEKIARLNQVAANSRD